MKIGMNVNGNTLARGAVVMLLVLAMSVGISQPTSAADGRFVNLSTRALVETGDEVMIGGFIIKEGSRQVLIQALGPELANAGISNALADPVLTVTASDGTELMVNDNWEDSQGQLVTDLWGGSPNLATGSLSSAAVLTLEPGNYTAKVEGKNGTAGVAIVEVYEIDAPDADGRFVNLSTRALVGTGNEVMIGGFIIKEGSRQVLIQALGPELASAGISNALADPVLTVTTSDGTELMVNDNWEDSQGQLVTDLWRGSPNLTAGSLSSAAVLTLDSGNYTAKVEGKNGAAGVAIVEVYGIESPDTGSPDREALTALYNAMDGANWTNNANWLSDAPLDEWHGVWVDGEGRVIQLDLADNQLNGPIPIELGKLASLQELDLDENQLSGPIPPELGNLANLKVLWLAENQLSGPIPTELGKLASLQDLDLFENQLSGPIPTEFGNLASLQELDLAGNQLSGPIPVELGNLANLEGLYLAGNQLSGPIPPELGNLANLRGLALGLASIAGAGNQLSGPIPPELGKLVNLRGLSLGKNQLSGPIPTELGNLANLQELDLAGNQLSGPIPVELGNLVNLVSLNLDANQLSGPIPPELGNLENLELLWLSRNQLSGQLPAELIDLSNLSSLHFHTNDRLCAPNTDTFTTWLNGIRAAYGPRCPMGPDNGDAQPRFPAGSGPGNQTYTVSTAMPTLTLPAASGGDGTLTYSLSPDVPGLRFNATSRQLTGTPSTASAYEMTYTVRNADGDTDTLAFTITVEDGDDPPPQDANGIYTYDGFLAERTAFLYDGRILGEEIDFLIGRYIDGEYTVEGRDFSAHIQGETILFFAYPFQSELDGTIVFGESLAFTFTDEDDEVREWNLEYGEELYERPASLSMWEGNWSSFNSDDELTSTLSINADGSFTMEEPDDCMAVGRIQVTDPGRNLYELSFELSECAFDGDNGAYTGFAYLTQCDEDNECSEAFFLADKREGDDLDFYAKEHTRD